MIKIRLLSQPQAQKVQYFSFLMVGLPPRPTLKAISAIPSGAGSRFHQ
ncbi:hypothetical protein [Eisenibacter elegans]|nr:hypothetical protein [Eisenibacter elegans]